MGPDVPWGAELVLDSIPLIAKTSSDYSAPTLAPGDVTVVKDGAAAANIATLPTQQPGSSTRWRLTLSATEMEARVVAVDFVDQTTPAEFEQQRIWIATELVRGFVPFTVVSDGGNAAGTFKTDLDDTLTDLFKNSLAKFNTGALAGGGPREVSGFNGTTKFLTFTEDFPATPSAGDKGVLMNK